MSSTQKFDLSTNASMSADFSSVDMVALGINVLTVQAVWTGANLTTGKIVPEASLDRTNWCSLVSIADSKRVDAVNGCVMYLFNTINFDWFRVSFLANGNSSGLITFTVRAQRL